MFAYKGFQRGLKCRGYQFSMGKNVTEAANCGQNGFHCAENPLDCLSYYGNINFSDYCLVIPGGDMDEDQVDSKISCTELTIVKKLTIQEFFLHGLAYMVDHANRRRTQPIHSIPYSVAQPLERGSNNYYSIIQGEHYEQSHHGQIECLWRDP